MDWKPYITADPQILHGTVCFRGTRVPVSVVLDNLAAGESTQGILDEYPSLKAEHIPAAVAMQLIWPGNGSSRCRFSSAL